MKLPKLMFDLFVNRSDAYARAYLNSERMAYSKQEQELTEEIIQEHLNQKITIGTYQLNGKKIKWACLDFDENTEKDFLNAQTCFIELKKQGFHPLLEMSGGGKYKCHVWIFCDDSAENTQNFLEVFCEEIQIKPHEIFPKQTEANESSPYGNLVKLPLAFHLATKQKSCFLNDNFEQIVLIEDVEEKLKYHLEHIDKIPKIIIKEKKIKEFPIQQKQPSEFDEFFNFVLRNELPPGISKQSVYPNIEGINSNILKNQAIWFCQKGYTLEELETDIKPIFQENGWAFGDLKGWFNKARKGEINQISLGELAEWCRTYREDLLELLPQEQQKSKNPYNELFYETKHLPYFDHYDKLIGLDGRQYTIIKKARYYQLIGGILQKKIQLGRTETDTRMHLLIPLPTEAGKNSFIYANKNLFEQGVIKSEGILFDISEPISYSAESLVGKVIEKFVDSTTQFKKNGTPKKVKMKIQNFGHLNCDFLELDECTKLIVSDDEEIRQAREYFSKAENTLGKNEIVKRLVDDLPSETIKYKPSNTDTFYFQPSERIPENLITQGFGRRKLIPVGKIQDFLLEGTEEMMSRKLESENFSKGAVSKELVKFLETRRRKFHPEGHPLDFTFTERAKELIGEYTLFLLRQGRIHSEKIANFTKVIKYTTQENLIKMSCILASAYNQSVVDERFVSLAFMDLTEIMQNTYDFVYSNVKGEFDYGVKWHGAKYYDKECLKWLYEKECFSYENSSISIPSFKQKIRETYPNNIGDDQAQKHYLRMRSEGWIDGRQSGQYGSKVWLKFKPELQKELSEGSKGDKGNTAYKSVFYSISTILSTLLPLLPLSPSREATRE